MKLKKSNLGEMVKESKKILFEGTYQELEGGGGGCPHRQNSAPSEPEAWRQKGFLSDKT
jgi:hypothetical protein